jgi:succinate-semialdehyde dehydrogenase/glutarate-semialdehyde dehydrogenase
MDIDIIDPHTGERTGGFDHHTDAQVDAALDRAVGGADAMRAMPMHERVALLERLATCIRDRVDDWAHLMVSEVGKPLSQARAEARKCAWVCEHYASTGPSDLLPTPIPVGEPTAKVVYEPLGVVFAIMPWNFPMWQVLRFAAPALMAGNGFVLKHAPNSSGCGEAIATLFRDAGFPVGVGEVVRVDNDGAAAIIGDDRVAAVTLTGSTRAGRAVAAVAGQHLKPCVLELGGSDPFVVLGDADVSEAAKAAVTARLQNNGQSCIAGKRFIVVESQADAFLDAFRAGLADAVAGDPRDESTVLGPMARADLRDELHRQVTASIAAGARCVLGGELPDGPGFHYPATLLLDCGPGMPAWDEELFGPVAAVRVVEDDDAAMDAAVHPTYGLGASIWTDPARVDALAPRVQAGAAFFNAMTASDPRVPFGGIKASGYGRELGVQGLHSFVNIKTVWVG